jgi:hypothetical protein
MRKDNTMNTTRYERREWLVTALIVVFFTTLILLIWNDFYDRMTKYSCDPTGFVVTEGTTIYQLGMAHCTGAREVAIDDAVKQYGTNLQIGQVIYLPISNDCSLRVTDGGEVFQDC